MTQHAALQNFSLFDLIARSWDLGSPVGDLCFNVIGSSVAVALADGHLAFLQVKDAEDPENRMRIEADSGRMTIRPRDKALPAPGRSEMPVADPRFGLHRVAQQGFVFVHRDGGEIWRATAKGQTLRVAKGEDAPVTALAALPDKGGLLVARGADFAVVSPEDGTILVATLLDHDVARIAVSPDATRIACWGAGCITVLDAQFHSIMRIAAEGDVACLDWSPDGRWLVGGCRDKALLLVDIAKGVTDRIVDFPAPVISLGFNGKAGAMIAAGAFRVVGWELPDLPFGTHEGTAIETGKPGLTVIETIAAHPERDLCAVGYANGLVTICQIGKPQEMMLREGGGDAVTALVWSPDGRHLAIGTANGTAAIATFPKNMFK